MVTFDTGTVPDPPLDNVGVPHEGVVQIPVKEFTPPVDSVDDLLTDDERCCLARLLAHLNSHLGYYWQQIWRAEQPADRAMRLAEWKIGGNLVSDLVVNTLLDVVGDCLVFPMSAGAEKVVAKAVGIERLDPLDEPFADYIEQILTLPARGVFAEAKLGNCNASELIDPTRFWDWQISPIPDEAPAIAPTSTDSRATTQAGTTPTSFEPRKHRQPQRAARSDRLGRSLWGADKLPAH